MIFHSGFSGGRIIHKLDMNKLLRDGGKISLLKLNNYIITTTLSISFPINLHVQNRKVEQSILYQIHLNEIYKNL